MSAPSFSEAMKRGWNGKEWLRSVALASEQEDVDGEEEEESFGPSGPREIFPGEDPDTVCMCPSCVRMRRDWQHQVELARAVLHCPETPALRLDRDQLERAYNDRQELEAAALNTPLARFIQQQVAIERSIGCQLS